MNVSLVEPALASSTARDTWELLYFLERPFFFLFV